MNLKVVPSLPAKSFTELADLGQAMKGQVDEIQVDIVDGVFVPSVAWPFTEPDPKEELSKLALLKKDFSLEVDCMVNQPEQYLDLLVALRVERIVIHLKSTEAYKEIFAHAKKHNYRVGLALTNDIPLDQLTPFIEEVSFVQLMGIAEIGKQGQPFDERTLDRVRELRNKYRNLEIAVDGSVNKDTIIALTEAGVNRFLPGSAVAKADNPAAAYQELLSLVTNRN